MITAHDFEMADFLTRLEVILTEGRYIALRRSGRYIVSLYKLENLYVELYCKGFEFYFRKIEMIDPENILFDFSSPIKIYNCGQKQNNLSRLSLK